MRPWFLLVGLCACGGPPFLAESSVENDAGGDREASPSKDAPNAEPDGGDELDAGSYADADGGSAETDGSSNIDADEGGPPTGCTADPSVCPTLGVTACTGWDCGGDAGLRSWNNEDCVRAGVASLAPGDTAYACGPYVIDGYIGDLAAKGCIKSSGSWCKPGSNTIYVCWQGAASPGANCQKVVDQTNSTGWCCP